VDNLEDCRIAAIEGIGALKAKDPRIYQVLLDGMDHDDPAIRLACYRALRDITGKDLGNKPAAWKNDLQAQLAAMTTSTGDPSTPPQSRVRGPAEQNSGPDRSGFWSP
jgi:hypothetical protein